MCVCRPYMWGSSFHSFTVSRQSFCIAANKCIIKGLWVWCMNGRTTFMLELHRWEQAGWWQLNFLVVAMRIHDTECVLAGHKTSSLFIFLHLLSTLCLRMVIELCILHFCWDTRCMRSDVYVGNNDVKVVPFWTHFRLSLISFRM